MFCLILSQFISSNEMFLCF